MDKFDRGSEFRDAPLAQPLETPATGQFLTTRISKARHDLRNPLSDILGFGQILQEEALAAGHHQLIPDFQSVHEAAAHIFAEVNHALNLDIIKHEPESIGKLQQTIQVYGEKIIVLTESLSEKCDALENNSFGDDLLRITGSARQLQTLAPGLLESLTQAEPAPVAGVESAAAALRPEAEGESVLPAAAPGKTPIHGTILVVDNNEADRAMLSRRLRRQGHTVALAENGRQALEKLHTRRFDLVLLDIVMPEMDGFEVLRRLKADIATQSIPVLMLSAVDEMDAVVRCIELGADDYLPKPFPPTLLMARVHSCLSNKHLTDQLRKYTEWLFGKTLFSQAVNEPQSLTLRRQERSVLFADIRGFTHWSENQTPEEVVEMLNRYFEAAEKICVPSAMIKLEHVGDEIMGVFPDPVSALQIALAFERQLGDLLEPLGLSIGLGIHTGPVIEGLVGGSDVKAYCFVGDTVNTAKRICDLAAARQTLISAAVYAAAADRIEVGEALDLQAKGKTQPLHVFPVIGFRPS